LKKTFFLLAALFLSCAALFAQTRKFADLYPNMAADSKSAVFSTDGLIRDGKGSEGLAFVPATGGNPQIASLITGKKPSFIVESLQVIPGKNATLLAVYNALNKIKDLKGRKYHSHTRGKEVALFEDATRIESNKKLNAAADLPAASSVPSTAKLYARLKDVNFGNTYYEISFNNNNRSILCDLTNFRTIYYILFPVMKEKTFTAVLYVEPLDEGLLVYSAAAAQVSDFVSGQINIPSALEKRLDVIIGWMLDGIR
jgi:hypothetical protein